MPEANAEKHVAGIDVIVAGAKLDPKWRDLTLEVKVVDSLTLPDMALVRLSDPKGDNVDSHPLQLGKDIEIKASAKGAQGDDLDLQGPDRRRRAGVHGQGLRDLGPRLRQGAQAQPPAQDAHVPADVGLRHGQQGRRRERPEPARSSPRASSTSSSSRATRPTGTSCWRLALMHDYEVVVADTDARLPPGERVRGQRRDRAHVAGQHDLVPPAHERHPAAEDGQRPRLGPEEQAGRRRARATSPQTTLAARRAALAGGQRPRRRHDRDRRPRRGQQRRGQRDRQGDAAAAWPTRSSRPTASPSATRRSRRAARSRSRASGQKFSGTYTVTSSTHSYRGTTGYQTTFQISGRSSRTLLELMRPPAGARLVRDARGRRGDQQQRPGAGGSGAREVPEPERQRGVGLGARRHARARATRAAC